MKKMMNKTGTACFLIAMSFQVHAQNFFRGEQTVILPLQVMIDNYTGLILGKEIANEPNANRFDKLNPYTYLQVIHDNGGKDYQVLFQTNFAGKVVYLAYSNNLSLIINSADKPQNVFLNCLKKVNDHLSSVQNAEAAVDCIIDRLNYCSNK